jgi:hypothetical protein
MAQDMTHFVFTTGSESKKKVYREIKGEHMKKVLILVAICLALCSLPQEGRAASSTSLEIVLWDSLLGAAIGSLVGAATLPFMDHPNDHYNRILQGASLGLLCGLGFGVYEISPMFYTTTTPSGQKERVYGLTVNIPLK